MGRLSGISLITRDLARLRAFYRAVLQVEPEDEGDGFTAFRSAGLALSLFTEQGMERLAPGSMAGAGHGACALEIDVQDVDAEHARLTGMGVPVVKPPATHPWGARSAWFRDPDGNIVSLRTFVPRSG